MLVPSGVSIDLKRTQTIIGMRSAYKMFGMLRAHIGFEINFEEAMGIA